MAKVSFYLFEQSNERQVDITCRLCRKILGKSGRIWLYSQDQALLQQLDDLLWSFDETSFLGHGIDQPHAPICLSKELPRDSDWIVFNFQAEALEQFEKFSHIIEIIENNEPAKQLGREKYKQYRRFGIEPQTHKL
jgi:DNA polymerase III subunit chi